MSLTTSVAAAVSTPILTTTFVPTASTCTENRLTMLANKAYEIWNNEIVPVPSSTFTDCYASQFMSSYLSEQGGVTQAAFNPLVCPINYSEVGPFTSNYIACCPSGYSFANPTGSTISDRPAFGGTCYTPLTLGTPYQVTAYGSSSVTATTTFAATVTNAQAYAYPYEGFAFGVAQVASVASVTGAVASATATGSGVAATHTVLISTAPEFMPNSVTASVGDTIVFEFQGGNHSVTQSTFDNPCQDFEGGYDSGFMANINGTASPIPQVSMKVSTSDSLWFFSKQTSDCTNGMTFALNPSSSQTESEFQAAAIASASKKSTGTSHTKAVGIGVGVSIGAVAIIGLGLAGFFLRRRRQQANYNNNTKSIELHDSPNSGEFYAPDDKNPHVYENEKDSKPPVPPKYEELHGLSSPPPIEMPAAVPAAELSGSTTTSYYNT